MPPHGSQISEGAAASPVAEAFASIALQERFSSLHLLFKNDGTPPGAPTCLVRAPVCCVLPSNLWPVEVSRAPSLGAQAHAGQNARAPAPLDWVKPIKEHGPAVLCE